MTFPTGNLWKEISEISEISERGLFCIYEEFKCTKIYIVHIMCKNMVKYPT